MLTVHRNKKDFVVVAQEPEVDSQFIACTGKKTNGEWTLISDLITITGITSRKSAEYKAVRIATLYAMYVRGFLDWRIAKEYSQ